MKAYTYLIVNFLTIIICLLASYDKRLQFNKHFGTYFKAAISVAIPFIAWDIWFTKIGVWWFDKTYTIGWIVAGLPIEEWLFFFCIPFACTFTYFCLDKFFDWRWARGFNNIIVFLSTVVCTVVALCYPDKIYTAATAVFMILTLIYLHFIVRKEWIGQASFIFFILMLGFFPVNGVLTGTGIESPIVNYNPKAFLGIRMGTIPIEDAVYGYAQFLWVLYFFKLFKQKELNEE